APRWRRTGRSDRTAAAPAARSPRPGARGCAPWTRRPSARPVDCGPRSRRGRRAARTGDFADGRVAGRRQLVLGPGQRVVVEAALDARLDDLEEGRSIEVARHVHAVVPDVQDLRLRAL